MADPEQKRRCPTCRHLVDADAFYANCAECKDCKRRRSQRNRALQARKLAAFERFVDALVGLADRAPEFPPERTASLTSTALMAAMCPVTQSAPARCSEHRAGSWNPIAPLTREDPDGESSKG
jgi:hypothetical protein